MTAQKQKKESVVAKAITEAFSSIETDDRHFGYDPEKLVPAFSQKDVAPVVAAITSACDVDLFDQIRISGGPISSQVLLRDKNRDMHDALGSDTELFTIVVGSSLGEEFKALHNPGFATSVLHRLQTGVHDIQIFPKGRVAPLVVDGNAFGILMMTDKQIADRKRHKLTEPQFTICMDLRLPSFGPVRTIHLLTKALERPLIEVLRKKGYFRNT